MDSQIRLKVVKFERCQGGIRTATISLKRPARTHHANLYLEPKWLRGKMSQTRLHTGKRPAVAYTPSKGVLLVRTKGVLL